MQVTSSLWQKHLNFTTGGTNTNKNYPTVVFTTESTSMVKEQEAFVSNRSRTKFPFEFNFVTNTKDVTPDSGFMKDIGTFEEIWSDLLFCKNWLTPTCSCTCLSMILLSFFSNSVYNKNIVSDADSIMLSAISSLKAQLLPRMSIGNCCSNFHTLLNDFLSEGCGAASSNIFLCLQEYEDPRLRVCCGWHKKCMAEKIAAINATAK